MNYDPYKAPAAPQIPNQYSSGTELSEQAVQELIGTQSSVRFVSILMMIGTGLMLVSLLLPQLVGSSRGSFSGDAAFGSGQMLGTLLACVLYVYPTVLLSRYAGAIQRFRTARMMKDFELALRHQRMFWRFVSIVSLVGVVIIVFSVIGMASIFSKMAR